MRGALGHSVDCAPEEPEKDTTEYEMNKNKKKNLQSFIPSFKKREKMFLSDGWGGFIKRNHSDKSSNQYRKWTASCVSVGRR